MSNRPVQSRVLPAALLALGVVLTLGSLGDPAIALAVYSQQAVVTRSESDAVSQFIAALAKDPTRPVRPEAAQHELTLTPRLDAPRAIAASAPGPRRSAPAVAFPPLFSLPPPTA